MPEPDAAARADDEALLAGMAAGDRDAAATFVGRHAPSVIGVAAAIVGDRHAAEDIAQEAFWRVWRAAATYDPSRGGVRSWTLAIARNAAIDHVRVRQARPVEPRLIADLLVCADHGSPDEDLIAGVEAAQVRRALAAVPEDQRRALVLAAVGGRTAAEVGAIEGIPLGTAKTRIRTGLRRLRDAMASEARCG